MDCNSSTKMIYARTPTPRHTKTSEKQTGTEDSAGQQVLDSQNKPSTRQKPLDKPGLSLEKKIELEKQRRHVLINEHNKLMFAVKGKEAKLRELQESLKATENLQPTNYNSEDTFKQRIRQLENNLDKMRMKITQAKEIQTVYWHIREHLQQEVRGMFKVLDRRECAVAIGQAEVDKATKQFQSAAAAADSALDRRVQMESETVRRKREMDSKLRELSAEEKELKRQMETFGRLSPTGQSRLMGQESEEEEEEEEDGEETPSASLKDHPCFDICGASQSDMKLVENMEALRETLGCADVQDLVSKVVSQQATEEQLLIELTRNEELIRQEAKALADLELRYTELKFGAKPTATRFDKLEEEMQAKLDQEVDRVQRLQAELRQSRDLLDAVEQGVNNLYFRMSCVPVEGLPSVSSTDSVDKLRDISARLPTLLQRSSQQEPEISGLDQERIYNLLEQLNAMEPRNIKRQTTPIDAPELSDDEEECAPSRDEIKHRSSRLIESEQSRKSSRRARRKP